MHSEYISGDIRHVDLWYPGVNNNPRALQIALMHVRAADDIQVSYDFERNGWVIKQASVFSWDEDDDSSDEDWQEVAFIQAWGRKRPTE